MSKLKDFFKELDDAEFPSAIQQVNSHMYEALEAQQAKSGGGKVTREILNVVKKCMDYVNLRLVKAHREYVASEVKLKTMVTDSMAYDALLKRRSGTSDSISERLGVKKKSPRKETGFSVVVTPTEGTVQDIREDLRKVSKETQDFPKLTDVILTKTGQLVLKVTSRQDTDKIKRTLEPWGERVKIVTPRRRRQRVLLLSLERDTSEDSVLDSIRSVLQDSGLDDDKELEVVRKIPTRAGRVNWVVDVDDESFASLIERRRLCIDFDRFRVVEYIQIMRCYKCQEYGHMASRCSGVLKCTKCAGEHGQIDCKSVIEACANCLKEKDDDETVDSEHRADSPDCPCFKKYRETLFSRRL